MLFKCALTFYHSNSTPKGCSGQLYVKLRNLSYPFGAEKQLSYRLRGPYLRKIKHLVFT